MKTSTVSTPHVSRRRFLHGVAATTAAFHVVPGSALGLSGATPPSDRLNIAAIGAGGGRADERQRGLFYRALFYMTNTVQEAYKLHYYPGRYAGDGANLQATREQALALLLERWALVDKTLDAGGPFLLGERFSAADIYLAMLVTWYPEESELLRRFPGIKRCFEAACARPGLGGVIAAHRAA